MNSLRSAWTPFLAGLPQSHRQAKGDAEARLSESCAAIYSLSDWYKILVRSQGLGGLAVVRGLLLGYFLTDIRDMKMALEEFVKVMARGLSRAE